MPISIDEVVTEVAPPPAPAREESPARETPAGIDPADLARALEHLAWRAERVKAD
jgi:hypothetical protein